MRALKLLLFVSSTACSPASATYIPTETSEPIVDMANPFVKAVHCCHDMPIRFGTFISYDGQREDWVRVRAWTTHYSLIGLASTASLVVVRSVRQDVAVRR